MPLHDWIDKYPQVKRLLQQPEEALLEATTPPDDDPLLMNEIPAMVQGLEAFLASQQPSGYILDGHAPRLVDAATFVAWLATDPSRQVCETWIVAPQGKQAVRVSTVFLAPLAFPWSHEPPPLFETMCFSEDSGLTALPWCRYATWEEAERGHQGVCLAVREWLDSQR